MNTGVTFLYMYNFLIVGMKREEIEVVTLVKTRHGIDKNVNICLDKIVVRVIQAYVLDF